LALAALVDAVARARRIRRQRALSDLAALGRQQFEEVIADAFRRHGYGVREVGGRGRADGGVDLVLVRAGETTVVQAKHWRSDRVGVQLIRELYGVQRARHAERSMFVAIGADTPPTSSISRRRSGTLVDGDELLRVIGAGLVGGPLVLPAAAPTSAPLCPACGGDMVRRTARRGPGAGEEFFGRAVSGVPGNVADARGGGADRVGRAKLIGTR
jgi:restriction system protein